MEETKDKKGVMLDESFVESIFQNETMGLILEEGEAFRELMAYYECAIMEVETKFNVLNKEFSLRYDRNPIETIKSRLKSPESIMGKLQRKKIPFSAEEIEDKLMDIAARSLKTKRMVITKLMEGGLYPYTRRYLGTFENHFSTIGLVGMNEAGLNAKWLRKDLTHPETQAFAKDVLNHMRQRLSDYQEQYGDLYNLEATPAESTAYRLAKHDKMLYPDIITANENGTPYYTNSSHLPVGYTEDIFSALDVQDELQTLYTSGTVFHAFLGEKLPDWKAAASLVRKIAENYRLPYYTLSPTYSVCKNHGYLAGEQPVCPFCGEKAEVYSRITGYYRPVQNWNDGKAQEFKDRRTYDIGASKLTHSGVRKQEPKAERQAELLNEIPELFATKTCPNCKQAEQLLDAAGIRYTVRFAEENRDTVRALGIRQAPTLVSGGQKWTGVSGVREFIAAKENANV